MLSVSIITEGRGKSEADQRRRGDLYPMWEGGFDRRWSVINHDQQHEERSEAKRARRKIGRKICASY